MAKTEISCLDGLKTLYEPDTMERKVLILATSDGNGRPNAMPFTSWSISTFGPSGWCLSVYVMVGHHTHELIEQSGQFTVNVPREGMQDTIDCCSSVSGRDHDKFKECGLTAVASRHVAPPAIGECCAHFECETRRRKPFLLTFPGEDKKPIEMTVFEGEILAVHADEGT